MSLPEHGPCVKLITPALSLVHPSPARTTRQPGHHTAPPVRPATPARAEKEAPVTRRFGVRGAIRTALPLAALALIVPALFVPNAGASARTAATATGLGFTSPSVVDPVHAYGEPDIRISALDGAAYA